MEPAFASAFPQHSSFEDPAWFERKPSRTPREELDGLGAETDGHYEARLRQVDELTEHDRVADEWMERQTEYGRIAAEWMEELASYPSAPKYPKQATTAPEDDQLAKKYRKIERDLAIAARYEALEQYEQGHNQYGSFVGPPIPGSYTRRIPPGFSVKLEKQYLRLLQHVWEWTRFEAYRDGTEKGAKKDELKKWPPEREEMFLRAIVLYPPVGRDQTGREKAGQIPTEEVKSRLGRNEWIANAVNLWLGLVYHQKKDENNKLVKPILEFESAAVDRKKISSHLQVLRGKFKEDKSRDFTEDTWTLAWYLGDPAFKGKRPELHELYGRVPPSTMSSVSLAPPYCLPTYDRPLFFQHTPTLPSQSSGSSSSLQDFSPVDFSMYLRSGCLSQAVGGHNCSYQTLVCSHRTLHIFTRSQVVTRGPHPHIHYDATLATTSEDMEVAQDCAVIHAYASLALPKGPITDPNPELSIDSIFSTKRPLDRNSKWKVRTRFFKDGKPDKWTNRSRNNEVSSVWQALRINHRSDNGGFEHTVPFGSEYWALKIGDLVGLQKNFSALTTRPISDHKDVMRQEAEVLEKIKRDIKSMTAVQEIFFCDNQSATKQQHRRCLIVYWQFSQTDDSREAGRTNFRNVAFSASQPEPREVYTDNMLSIQKHLHEHFKDNGDGYLHHPHPQSVNALASIAVLDSVTSGDNVFSTFNSLPLDHCASGALPTEHSNMADASTYGFVFPSDPHCTSEAADFNMQVFDPALDLDFRIIDMAGSQPRLQSRSETQSPSPSSLTSAQGRSFESSEYHGGVESRASTASTSYQEGYVQDPAKTYDSHDQGSERNVFEGQRGTSQSRERSERSAFSGYNDAFDFAEYDQDRQQHQGLDFGMQALRPTQTQAVTFDISPKALESRQQDEEGCAMDTDGDWEFGEDMKSQQCECPQVNEQRSNTTQNEGQRYGTSQEAQLYPGADLTSPKPDSHQPLSISRWIERLQPHDMAAQLCGPPMAQGREYDFTPAPTAGHFTP